MHYSRRHFFIVILQNCIEIFRFVWRHLYTRQNIISSYWISIFPDPFDVTWKQFAHETRLHTRINWLFANVSVVITYVVDQLFCIFTKILYLALFAQILVVGFRGFRVREKHFSFFSITSLARTKHLLTEPKFPTAMILVLFSIELNVEAYLPTYAKYWLLCFFSGFQDSSNLNE